MGLESLSAHALCGVPAARLGDVFQDFWGWVDKLELRPRHPAAGALESVHPSRVSSHSLSKSSGQSCRPEKEKDFAWDPTTPSKEEPNLARCCL